MDDKKRKRNDRQSQYLDPSYRTSFTGTAETYIDEEQENATNDTYGEPSANQVNVCSAINQYYDIQRELTTCLSREKGSEHSHHRKNSITIAEEGGPVETIEEFNLTDFLSGFSEDADRSGAKPKRQGIMWKDLVVKGLRPETNTILNNFNVVVKALQPWRLFGIGKRNRDKHTILHSMTGFVKEGEMLLVLGRPGSGCTSFLKILANVRHQYTDVEGDLNYGGIDAHTFGKRYRGQSIYNEEEDHHLYPTLTTRQTLEFILRCKTPGTRLPNETKKVFINRVIYLLGNMLGLTKQMDTMVGGGSIPIPGSLTAGERKRVSIAEVMTTFSDITCWDCSTSGLDAVSALNYVRSLRIMTDIFKKTTVSVLYQSSNIIYKMYDKLVILDNGHCIYFGPTNQAKAYFENLGFYCPPQKPIADFLTGLCNPLERQTRPGFEHVAPQNTAQFEQRYRQSQIYQDILISLEAHEQEMKEINSAGSFEEAVRSEHQKFASMHDPYAASFFQQVKALFIRQYHLQRKDRNALIVRYITIVVQALITAACFFELPLNGLGALLRCGAIFVSLLFITSLSQSELILFMTGPLTMEKYRHFAVYRSGALYLVQMIFDIPHAVVQILLYEICSYFMFGFYLDAGRFFTFFIILVFFNMMMNGLYRFVGCCSTNWTLASQIMGSLMLVLSTYAGFVIPYHAMKPWLFWIFWFNPFGYTYQALLKNEMKGQVFSCDEPGNSVPEGPGYDWPYKACLLKGGSPGENFVLGDNFIKATFTFKTSYLWAPDFVVIVAYCLLFAILASLAFDYFPSRCGRSITKAYLTGKSPSLTHTNNNMSPKMVEKTEQERLHCQKLVIDGIIPDTTAFSWHHISYTVSTKTGPLTLVNDISGVIKPGQFTAVMGLSGTGKTSLLDVLTRRKTVGKVAGHMYLNGEALLSDFERITGYCEQTDILHPILTVRETLRFSAYLRQEKDIRKDEKNAYVEQIITLLELNAIADAQVGNSVYQGDGISVEEHRRLSIAKELANKPKLLFLDEPTSGLDAQGSFNVIHVLRKLADAGLPILCVIHQPSWILFQQFDHLLLLAHGGRTVYNGPIGKDARTIIDYFQLRGAPIFPMDQNPAEYILEIVGNTQNSDIDHIKATHQQHSGVRNNGGYKDWVKLWQDSDEAYTLNEELEGIHQNANQYPSRKTREYATGFWYQLWTLQKRMHLDYWRSPGYNVGRFFTCMFISLITGFTYWKMKFSVIDMQDRVFVIFSTFLLAQTLILLSQPLYSSQKLYFQRDYGSRYYSYLSYGISSVLVEIPYCIFLSAFFMFGFYWSSGLSNTSNQVGFFFIFIVFFLSWAVTFGFVLAAISKTPLMASVITPLFVSLLILFAGWMRPAPTMIHFWKSWMYWLDPFHYCIEALTVNEMKDLVIQCNPDDFIKFDPPLGRTCGSYMEQYFSNPGSTGYIDNPAAVVECHYCQYSTGKEYYTKMYGWSEENRGRNLGIIVGFFAFNAILLQVLIFLTRKPKR